MEAPTYINTLFLIFDLMAAVLQCKTREIKEWLSADRAEHWEWWFVVTVCEVFTFKMVKNGKSILIFYILTVKRYALYTCTHQHVLEYACYSIQIIVTFIIAPLKLTTASSAQMQLLNKHSFWPLRKLTFISCRCDLPSHPWDERPPEPLTLIAAVIF